MSFELLLEQIPQLVRDTKKRCRQNYEIEIKQKDASPVTDVDHFINERLMGIMSQLFPNDTIVSEETEKIIETTNENTWYIDPLDGTKDFINNTGEWAIQLGLSVYGQPHFGIIAQVESDKVYYAQEGQGAFEWNLQTNKKTRLKMQTRNNLTEACLLISRNRKDPMQKEFETDLNISKNLPCGSIGVKFAKMATSEADLYIQSTGQCSLWDTCGPEIFLKEAGGDIFHFDGDPINYRTPHKNPINKGFIACNQGLSDELKEYFKARPEKWGLTR